MKSSNWNYSVALDFSKLVIFMVQHIKGLSLLNFVKVILLLWRHVLIAGGMESHWPLYLMEKRDFRHLRYTKQPPQWRTACSIKNISHSETEKPYRSLNLGLTNIAVLSLPFLARWLTLLSLIFTLETYRGSSIYQVIILANSKQSVNVSILITNNIKFVKNYWNDKTWWTLRNILKFGNFCAHFSYKIAFLWQVRPLTSFCLSIFSNYTCFSLL